MAILITLGLLLQGGPTSIQVAPGFQVDAVYAVADPLPGGLGQPPWDMDIDPLSGRLFIAQTIQEGGNILWLDLPSQEHGSLPFFSQALGFAADGTLYFGVSNFILGTWQRDEDVFLKFAIIPSVRGVDANERGLFVAESSFGPPGLYPDTVLNVDQGDGFFEPRWSTLQAMEDTDLPLNVMTSLAADNLGNIYAGFHTGELIRKGTDGAYESLNRRQTTIGGLNEFNITADPKDVLYQYDVSSGQLFAFTDDGATILVAYGDAIKGRKFSNGALASDGVHLYFVADYQVVYMITPSEQPDLHAALSLERPVVDVVLNVIDQLNGDAVLGARVRVHNGQSATTDDQGEVRFQLAEGLYEIVFERPGYRLLAVNLTVSPGTVNQFTLAMNPGLPDFVAAGISAEILLNQERDGIDGASDIAIHNDHIYVMNFRNGTITQHGLDPDGNLASTHLFAVGGGLANSFIVSVDADNVVYASIGNDGVMQLPQQQETYYLQVDPLDPSIVRDQLGNVRTLSLIRDVDGIAIRRSGDMLLSSGAGGAPTPAFPDGTFNTLILRTLAGVESVFSRGIPATGESPLFSNNDIAKLDLLERVLIGTRTGDVVRVDEQGVAELIWPGSGLGKPDGLGAFSCLNGDNQGHLFIRGDSGDGSRSLIRMITPDGEDLIDLAEGLSQCFGGFEFDQQGTSILISDDRNVIRLRSVDGRSIAENLVSPSPRSARHRRPSYRALAMPHVHHERGI